MLMCCNGQTVDVSYSAGTLAVRTTSTCLGVDIDLLTMFKEKVDCVLSGNLYDQLGYNREQIQNASDILTNWIVAKQADPATCEYFEYLVLIQLIVQKTVTKQLCI